MIITSFQLTPEQLAAVQPVLDEASAAYAAGKPGMVIGQIFKDGCKVSFLPQEPSLRVLKALGVQVCTQGGVDDLPYPYHPPHLRLVK
jgi:hypothetical protein